VLPRRLVDVVLIAAIIAFVAAGVVFYGTCDGGDSLILFGVAVAFLAALLFRMGAWATVLPFAIVTLTLIAGGWYGASMAGCQL
jgi:hypothetical protein